MKLIQKLAQFNRVHWALMDQGIVSLSNFLTGIILARALGMEAFGRFSLIWIGVLFLSNLQTALVSFPMMSIGPKVEEKDSQTYYTSVFYQQLFFSLMVSAAIAIGAKLSVFFFPEWHIEPLWLPLLCVSFAFLMQDYVRRYFFAVQKPMYAFINDMVSYFGQILLLSAVWYSTSQAGESLDVAMILGIIALTSALALGVGLLGMTHLFRFNFSELKQTLVRHWHFGSWMTVSNTIQWGGSQGLLMIAGLFLGPASVGGIRAVINLTAPVNVLMQGLQNYFPVHASEIYGRDGPKAMIQYLLKSMVLILMALGLICLPVVFFSDTLMELFYGQEYLTFSPLVLWQSVYILLGGALLPVSIYYRTTEDTRKYAICLALSAPAAILATYLTIQASGASAVYYGLIVNQGMALVLALGFFKLLQKLFLKKNPDSSSHGSSEEVAS